MPHKRSKAFILPLAISVLMLVAGLAAIGFAKISHTIDLKNLAFLHDDVIRDRITIMHLTNELDEFADRKIDVIKNKIDGLYNISMITVTNFDEVPDVNIEQFAFVKRKSAACGLPQNFPNAAFQVFKDYGVPNKPYTLIDFLALSNTPPIFWDNVFRCFRIAPKNQLLDISNTSLETIALYFDISQSQAAGLMRAVNDGKIKTKAGVVSYLNQINPSKIYDSLVSLTKMDRQNNHIQIFFMSNGENFAYQEKVRDRGETWNDSRIIFGWTPEVLN